MSHKQLNNPKLTKFEAIVHKYSMVLSNKEIYEILNAGQYIYSPDNGLTYKEVCERLGLPWEPAIY